MTAPLLNCADAARILEAGGVLLLTTDTLPGLHARVDRPDAVARIAMLKGRSEKKALLLLVASSAAVHRVAVLARRQRIYADCCWPGPFSLILPAVPGLSAAITAGSDTVAVRVPRAPLLQELLDRVGVPLVSTSANRSGEAPATDLAGALAIFGDQVDGVCDPGDAPVAAAAPSALVDLTAWPPRILRQGPEALPEVAGLDLPERDS